MKWIGETRKSDLAKGYTLNGIQKTTKQTALLPVPKKGSRKPATDPNKIMSAFESISNLSHLLCWKPSSLFCWSNNLFGPFGYSSSGFVKSLDPARHGSAIRSREYPASMHIVLSGRS